MFFSRSLLFLTALSTAGYCNARSPEQQNAVDLYHARKNSKAATQFAKLTANEPANAEVQHYLGLLALRNEDFAAARTHHEKAVALAPTNSAYHLRLGDAYLLTGEKSGVFAMSGWLKKCKAAYDKALELEPTNIEARANLVEYYQDVPGFMGGGMDKAYAQADEIAKLDPVRGHIARASVLVTEKKYPEAFEVYDAALTDAPGDYRALYGCGRLSALSGQRIDSGIALLQKAIAIPLPATSTSYAPAQWRLGMLFEKKGDKVSARAAYEAALKADSKFDCAKKALRSLD